MLAGDNEFTDIKDFKIKRFEARISGHGDFIICAKKAQSEKALRKCDSLIISNQLNWAASDYKNEISKQKAMFDNTLIKEKSLPQDFKWTPPINQEEQKQKLLLESNVNILNNFLKCSTESKKESDFINCRLKMIKLTAIEDLSRMKKELSQAQDSPPPALENNELK